MRLAGTTESSRSRIKASAPDCRARASLRSLSAGTKRRERTYLHLRSAFHQTDPSADRDRFAPLVDPLMLELDDAGVPARLAAPLRPHDRARTQRIAVKHRLGEPDIAHPQICDRGPERRFADAHADNQPERE